MLLDEGIVTILSLNNGFFWSHRNTKAHYRPYFFHWIIPLFATLQYPPVLIFANQAGLDMLETTLVALQDVTLDKIFDESGRKSIYADFSRINEQVIKIHLVIVEDLTIWVESKNSHFFPGICLSTCWSLHVDNGPSCFIWSSNCLESVCHRWDYSSLSCFHICQLVFCVKKNVGKNINLSHLRLFIYRKSVKRSGGCLICESVTIWCLEFRKRIFVIFNEPYLAFPLFNCESVSNFVVQNGSWDLLPIQADIRG